MGIPLNEVEMDLAEIAPTMDADVVSGDSTLAAEGRKANKQEVIKSRRDLERYMEDRALEKELDSWY